MRNEYAEAECGNEKRNKKANAYGAPPKCEHRLTQQRRAVDECGFVRHGAYRFNRNDRARKWFGLPPKHNGLIRCSTWVGGVVMPPIYQSNGIECY